MTLNLMAEPAFQYVTHTEYLLKLTKKQPNNQNQEHHQNKIIMSAAHRGN